MHYTSILVVIIVKIIFIRSFLLLLSSLQAQLSKQTQTLSLTFLNFSTTFAQCVTFIYTFF